MDLMSAHNEKKGSEKLFTETVAIDWYDGIVTGLCRLESGQWFIANLCYYAIYERLRIFSIIETDQQWADLIKKEFSEHWAQREASNTGEMSISIAAKAKATAEIYNNTMKEIKKNFLNYKGPAYLLKGQQVDEEDYELIEIAFDKMVFYPHVEKVVNQSKKSAARWLAYFS